MGADLPNIFTWWLILFFIGIIVLPSTTKLFNLFFDRGYAFSKILGLLLLSYLSWLLPSLHLLKFNQTTILLILALLVIINSILFLKNRNQRPKTNDQRQNGQFAIIIFEEFLFLAGLLFWSFVRAQEPSIHGLEKFMDFGFMNSILRSDYFPPQDLWLTPLTINYYYFGHLWASVLFKLSTIPPEIGYNLVLASIFGLSLSSVFSLGFNLFFQFLTTHPHNSTHNPQLTTHPKLSIINKLSIKPALIVGLLATFLVNLGGNLHTIYAFTQGYPNEKPVPFWQLPLGWTPQSYWYPNATRFIPFTIHEFPIYSYVVADLHGHVLNIPFVLLTLAFLFAIFFSKRLATKDYLLLPLLVAILYMTNATDGLVYGGLSTLIIFYKWWTYMRHKPQTLPSDNPPHPRPTTHNSPLSRYQFIIHNSQFIICLVWLAIGFFLFSLPFSANFKPFVKGIGIVPPNGHSPLYMLLILWGLPLFFAISFTLFHFGQLIKRKLNLLFKAETLVKLIAKLTGTPIEIKKNYPVPTTHNSLPIPDILVFILLIVSFGLIIFPEFFYFRDIYPLHYRANTMFKLGYQAFIMFGVCGAYVLVRLLQSRKVSPIFLIFSFLFLILVSIYPYFAIKSYYGNLQNYKTLDGMAWLKTQYPSDYDAIQWIRKNIKGQPVILEGVGESYTDYARVSAFTGLPTVIGWPVHEWLWRGTYDEAGKRVAEMQQLFESTDLEFSKNMLKKYSVKFVFIGQLEKQKYPKLNEEQFNQLGKKIFDNGVTRIYELE